MMEVLESDNLSLTGSRTIMRNFDSQDHLEEESENNKVQKSPTRQLAKQESEIGLDGNEVALRRESKFHRGKLNISKDSGKPST